MKEIKAEEAFSISTNYMRDYLNDKFVEGIKAQIMSQIEREAGEGKTYTVFIRNVGDSLERSWLRSYLRSWLEGLGYNIKSTNFSKIEMVISWGDEI